MVRPSHIVLAVPPLTATLGRAELESAAALLVRACQALGDEWVPRAWLDVAGVLQTDVLAATEPFASLVHNPFFRPDFAALVKSGWATRDESDRIALTPEAIAKIAARWARLPTPDAPAAPDPLHPRGAAPRLPSEAQR